KLLYKLAAKLLPSGSFRRLQAEKTAPQKFLNYVRQNSATRREPSVAVKRLAKEFPSQRVHHHVAWPGVESNDVIRSGTRPNRRYIRNSADIQRDPAHALITIQSVIEQRDQRRALASGRHISRAKIRHHGHAQQRRNARGLTGLPGDRQSFPQEILGRALMVNRLPV